MDYRNISRTNYKINDFLSFQRNGSLVLSPMFQRRPVWPKIAKSYLIDTIVRGLPIPIIFLREHTDLQTLEPKREVVDGQQRLRTIISFIEPSLLTDYNPVNDDFVVIKSHNEDIARKKFDTLESRDKQRILNYEFSVHILPSETEDREVLQIFSRMNSTGLKLSYQELRNAEFFGQFKEAAYSLAYEQLNRWRNWGVFSENEIARMVEVETTSDLIRLIIEGLQSFSQPALTKLYRKYENDFPIEKEVLRRFRIVMDNIDNTVGSSLRSLQFKRKALFQTLFVFYYNLIFGLDSELSKINQKPLSNHTYDAVMVASDMIKNKRIEEDLLKVLRGATGNLESRRARLEFLRKIYKSVQA